jgi:hypothetical protein
MKPNDGACLSCAAQRIGSPGRGKGVRVRREEKRRGGERRGEERRGEEGAERRGRDLK